MEKSKVLCVDDDLPLLKDLRHFNWDACQSEWIGEASNGREALGLIESECPDIVLIDIIMPVMDGLECIRQTRQRQSHTQFIIISSHGDFDYARQALRYSNVKDYLIKGEYSENDLGQAIQKITGTEIKREYRHEVQMALDAVLNHLSENITLESLAAELQMTPNYLGALFFRQTGKHFRDFLNEVRMSRAKELLMHTPLRIYEVAEQVGIHNSQYFCTSFKAFFGLTPSQVRK